MCAPARHAESVRKKKVPIWPRPRTHKASFAGDSHPLASSLLRRAPRGARHFALQDRQRNAARPVPVHTATTALTRAVCGSWSAAATHGCGVSWRRSTCFAMTPSNSAFCLPTGLVENELTFVTLCLWTMNEPDLLCSCAEG
jgi:hypothetical protein